MRFTSIIFLLLSLLPLSRGAEAEFQRVWPQWRDAKDFDRIGEYFGGNESSDKHRMLRTSEAGREEENNRRESHGPTMNRRAQGGLRN